MDSASCDGLVGVQQAGALLGGGGAEVAGGAEQDLLDQRGRRGGAGVGLPVGLDDIRRGARHERRGLAGAAALLDVGGLAEEVDAAYVGRTGVAGGEAQVAGRDQVHRAAGLVEPARAQRADVVAQPAGRGEVAGGGVVGLGVHLELRRGADRDDVRVGRRRADGVGRARVAAGDGDHHARRDRRVVELLGHIQRGDVGERVAAERLVEHVDVVGLDRVVDGLQEVGLGGVLEGAEHVKPDQAGAGGHALDPDVAGRRVGCAEKPFDVVDLDALAGDRVGVEERLVAGGELAGPVAGEVLVVAAGGRVEHRRAVGA